MPFNAPTRVGATPPPVATPEPKYKPEKTPAPADENIELTATTVNVPAVVGTNADNEISTGSAAQVIVQAAFVGTGSAMARATLSDGCTTLQSAATTVQADQTTSFPAIDARSLKRGAIQVAVRIGNTVIIPGTEVSLFCVVFVFCNSRI